MKKLLSSSIALGVLALAAFATNANSGLSVGEKVSAFHPTHVSGPLKDSTNCFPCTFKNRPQVQVWVNGDSMENVAAIAKMLDAKMRDDREFKALIVFVTNDAATTAKALKAAGKMPGLETVGMAYLSPKDEAITAYKINLSGDVKNTVFVYKDWTVAAKMVNLKGDETGLKSLGQAVGSVAK
ncbi:MAG TPA: hypothetical protein PLH94_05065 [Fimbriimonadaceae bacterium]|nr:hypothetical protein [Fimbriimonadaceae bacterium]